MQAPSSGLLFCVQHFGDLFHFGDVFVEKATYDITKYLSTCPPINNATDPNMNVRELHAEYSQADRPTPDPSARDTNACGTHSSARGAPALRKAITHPQTA